MDGGCIGHFGRGDYRRDVEITVCRRRWTNADRFLGQTHVLGVGVGFGMQGNGTDAKVVAGPQYTQRDLATVGDNQFFDHRPTVRGLVLQS